MANTDKQPAGANHLCTKIHVSNNFTKSQQIKMKTQRHRHLQRRGVMATRSQGCPPNEKEESDMHGRWASRAHGTRTSRLRRGGPGPLPAAAAHGAEPVPPGGSARPLPPRSGDVETGSGKEWPHPAVERPDPAAGCCSGGV